MKELISKLEALNFKDYEAKILLELIQGGILAASDLAEKTKVKRSTVYYALKKFIAAGYCNEIETNSITQYQIIAPEVIGDKMETQSLKAHVQTINTIKEITSQLKKIYKSKESEESKVINIELIRGHNKHRRLKFLELFKEAKNEVLFMVRLEHGIIDELDENAEKFLQAGGIIKSIYEVSSEFRIQKKGEWSKGNTNDLIAVLEKFQSTGEDLRISDRQISNTTIFDRETVYTHIQDEEIPRHNNSDIIVRNKDNAKNMIDLFNFYWENSFTIEEYKAKLLNEKK
jgi:sugar-specific transcriptional regulator TrmB